ncbi:MAG: asparagine synthetase A [Thermoplasmataceae archaeon]
MEEGQVNGLIDSLQSEQLKFALRINGTVRSFLSRILFEKGFLEIPPVLFSTATDPLNHPVFDTSFEYYGTRYSITKSMIFHKQIAVQYLNKIFTFSPNVRLEAADKALTGRHLSEFTQIDIEQLHASRDDMINLAEELIVGVIEEVKRKNHHELFSLAREIRSPSAPFSRIDYEEALRLYGKDFESHLSRIMAEPFWIVNIPLKEREFYDREDPEKEGYLLDMDLIYPEGYGEASSGGEREYEIDRILKRVKIKNQEPEQFGWFVDVARKGLAPSAGFGIGIERLVRYLCGFNRIEAVTPFPKVPGCKSI